MSTPTPPPPAPYTATAPAPIPVEPEQPGLSEGARLINVFISPRKTFEDLRRNSRWWIPWVVTAVFMLLMSAVIVQKVDIPRLVEHRMEQSKMAQRQMEQAGPAQREKILQLQTTITKIQFFARPAFTLIFGLIGAAILMAIFNFGFGAEVSFSQSLAVTFYASLPGVVRSILVMVSLLVSADPSGIDPDINPIATNPGFFMDREANKFLWGLASGLDVIAIWTLVLTAIGYVAVSNSRKLSTGAAMTTMFALYALLILIGAGAGAAF
jgi:hypothetical protein